MDSRIEKALATPPDYSPSFTARMEAIRSDAEKDLAVPVYLNSDMNYAVSQRISVFMDADGRPVARNDSAACFELVALLSSRADLYTVVQVDRIARNEWRVAKEVRIESTYLSKLMRVVEAFGFSELRGGQVLDQLAPECTTGMDGVPATIFQALFSEMY